MTGDFGFDIEKSLEFQRHTEQHLIQAFELPTDIGRYDTTSVNVLNENENALLSFGLSLR